MKSFKNKKIVITGAGSGLGRALAVRFSREGAALALTDISEHGLAQTDLCWMIGWPVSTRLSGCERPGGSLPLC